MKNHNQEWTDEGLVKAIREGLPHEREMALYHLFSNGYLFQLTRQVVVNYQGSDQDAEDVFHEVFIIFERNIQRGNFKFQSSLHTYFMGIVKRYWQRYHEKRGKYIEFDTQLHDVGKIELEDGLSEIEKKIVDYALSQLGLKCKEILLLTGTLDTNKEIAEKMGFSSADMARKEVYRCRTKFKDLLIKHPQLDQFLRAIIEK